MRGRDLIVRLPQRRCPSATGANQPRALLPLGGALERRPDLFRAAEKFFRYIAIIHLYQGAESRPLVRDLRLAEERIPTGSENGAGRLCDALTPAGLDKLSAPTRPIPHNGQLHLFRAKTSPPWWGVAPQRKP